MAIPHRTAVFASACAASLLVAGGHLYSPDEEIVFRVAQALAFEGRISIEPLDPGGFATKTGRDGRHYAQYGVGQSVLAVPFVWLGEGLGRWLGPAALALNPPWKAPLAEPSAVSRRFACSLFNAFVLGALAAVLYSLAFALAQSRKAAWAAAMTYALATVALPHSKTFFTEPLATLCIFGAVFHLWRAGETKSTARFLAGGALAASSVFVRVDSIAVLPALGLYALYLACRAEEAAREPWRRRIRWRRLIAFGAPFALAGAGLAALNWWKFGGILQTGYEDQPEGVQFATPMIVGLHGLLCSPGRGLFFFSPPLALSLWAFGALWRRDRALCLAAAAAVACLLAFHSKWINWAGGWDWGPRHIYMAHIFLALPIALWLAERTESAPRRIAWAALFCAGLAVQLYGSSQDPVACYRALLSPFEEPTARPLYSQMELDALAPLYHLTVRGPDGQAIPVPLTALVAPQHDTVYIPQSSVWRAYADLAAQGKTDFLWLRLLK